MFRRNTFQVARDSLAKNQADYVLANDLTTIKEDQHIGHLLTADKNRYRPY